MRLLRLTILVIGVCLLSTFAHADEKATALFKEVETATKAVKTLSADVVFASSLSSTFTPGRPNLGTLKLKRPNLIRFTLDNGTHVYSNGRTKWLVYPSSLFRRAGLDDGTDRYVKVDADPDGKVDLIQPFAGTFFFSQFLVPQLFPSELTRVADSEVVDGVQYRVIESISSDPRFLMGRPQTHRLYISREGVILGDCHVYEPFPGVTQRSEHWLKNVRLNDPIPDSEFEYTPPANARPLDKATRLAWNPPMASSPGFQLIAPGTAAPEFTLPLIDGTELTLASALKDKRAVLLLFWHCCEGGQETLPLLQKLNNEFRDKGLMIVAINSSGSSEGIAELAKNSGFTFTMVRRIKSDAHFDIRWKYGVDEYPIAYVLDGDGKVVWRAIGFKEDEIRAALEKLGVK